MYREPDDVVIARYPLKTRHDVSRAEVGFALFGAASVVLTVVMVAQLAFRERGVLCCCLPMVGPIARIPMVWRRVFHRGSADIVLRGRSLEIPRRFSRWPHVLPLRGLQVRVDDHGLTFFGRREGGRAEPIRIRLHRAFFVSEAAEPALLSALTANDVPVENAR